jgi:hypothetical protein
MANMVSKIAVIQIDAELGDFSPPQTDSIKNAPAP